MERKQSIPSGGGDAPYMETAATCCAAGLPAQTGRAHTGTGISISKRRDAIIRTESASTGILNFYRWAVVERLTNQNIGQSSAKGMAFPDLPEAALLSSAACQGYACMSSGVLSVQSCTKPDIRSSTFPYHSAFLPSGAHRRPLHRLKKGRII